MSERENGKIRATVQNASNIDLIYYYLIDSNGGWMTSYKIVQ